MTKENLTRLLILLLMMTLCASCLVSSTFAKYSSGAQASDVARVAKWSINVGENGGVNIAGGVFNFDLFETVYDAALDGEGNPVTEDAVKIDPDNPIIAPGTQGRFAFDIVNNSEVVAAYTVKFSIENPKGVPLLFSLDGEEWVDSVDALNNIEERAGVKALIGVPLELHGDEKTVTVYWKWLFEQSDVALGDEKDTSLGIEKPTVRMSATATVTQVD